MLFLSEIISLFHLRLSLFLHSFWSQVLIFGRGLYANLLALFAGFIDDICFVHGDSKPVMKELSPREVCVVSDTQPCDVVYIYAAKFAVTSKFVCRMVCIG